MAGLGKELLAAGRPAEAIERARFALERMPPEELRLRVLAKLLLVESMVVLGQPVEALPHFQEAKTLCEQADPRSRLLADAIKAQLLGCVRESEKLFRQTVKTFFDQEQYKQAFIALLTLFECLCRRGALGKAAALCEEAIAATSEAGEACNEQIRRVWEELLAAVPPPLPVEGERPPATFREAREEYDRRIVAAALEQSGGRIGEASRRLGISRNTLKAKMRRHGL